MGSKKPGTKTKKKPAEPAAKPQAKGKRSEEREGFRGIVRIAGKDITGHVKLSRALLRVRGISHSLAVPAAMALESELGLKPDMEIGNLTDAQIEKLDKILFSLQDHKVPSFMLNRRMDRASGKDRNVIMNDLLFENREDIEGEKKAYSWRGYRHAYGQKVRGQKTRNTGRSGMAVGVLRKAVIAAQGGKGGAKPGEKSGEKKK